MASVFNSAFNKVCDWFEPEEMEARKLSVTLLEIAKKVVTVAAIIMGIASLYYFGHSFEVFALSSVNAWLTWEVSRLIENYQETQQSRWKGLVANMTPEAQEAHYLKNAPVIGTFYQIVKCCFQSDAYKRFKKSPRIRFF